MSEDPLAQFDFLPLPVLEKMASLTIEDMRKKAPFFDDERLLRIKKTTEALLARRRAQGRAN